MIAPAPSLDLRIAWDALQTIASEGDRARVPAAVARAAVDATGALEGFVVLGAGEHWTVAARAGRESVQALPPGTELARFAPLESAVVHEVAHSRRPVLQTGPPPLLCVPMLGGGGVAGVLCLLGDGPGFAAERQRVAELIALQAGAALAPLPAPAARDDRAQEQRLLERIQAAVVVHGADTAIVSCNAHARALLGLGEGEVMGRTASDPGWFFLREDGSRMPPQEYPVHQVAARRQPLRNLVAGVRRTGQAPDVWVMVSADPVFDAHGGIVETIVTFVDITERRRSEQAYASLVNTIDGIVWEAVLPDMRFVFVSPQAERLLGYPPEQ